MFEGYLGQALHVARMATGLTQDEVLEELNKRTGRNFSLGLFDGMEKDIEEIDEETFDIWCGLFEFGKIKILKCAQGMQQDARRPEEEVIQGLLDELDYREWKDGLQNE